MTSELSSDAWARDLSGLQHKSTVQSLRSLSSARTSLISGLADFLHQRSLLEQDYAASLQKLVKKFGGIEAHGLSSSSSRSGGEKVWERVVNETLDTANSHISLAGSYDREFSDGLRSLPNRLSSVGRLQTMDRSIDGLLKAQESVSKQIEKHGKKGGSKLQTAQQESSSISQSLSSEFPSLIKENQQLTLRQLQELKEFSIKFETLQAELGNARSGKAESAMEGVLGWEVDSEVRRIGERIGGGRPDGGGGGASREREISRNGTASSGGLARNTSFRPPSNNDFSSPQRPSTSSVPSQLRPSDMRQNSSSASFRDRDDSSGFNVGRENSSLTSTFKSKFSRKSTMLGPSGGGLNKSTSSMMPNGGGRTRSGSDLSVARSGSVGGNGMGMGMAGAGRQGANGRFESMGSGADGERSAEVLRTPSGTPGPVDADGFSVPPPNREQAPWERSGGRDLLDEDDEEPSRQNVGGGGGGGGETDSLSALPSPPLGGPPKINMSLASLPIEESEADRQAALHRLQSTLLSKPPSDKPTRRNTVNRRREVPGGDGSRQNSRMSGMPMASSTLATLPDDVPLGQALNQRNMDGAGSGSGMPSITPLAISSGGNARQLVESPGVESPSTNNFTSPFAAGGTGASLFSTPAAALPPNLTTSRTAGRSDSLMSSNSGSGTGGNPFEAATQTTGSGLRASITESVSITSKGGLVQTVGITGEITFSLRDIDKLVGGSNGSRPKIHIKLTEFEELEKVAPNAKYLSQYPDTPGEYWLNTEALASASVGHSSNPVLFKYQLHVPEGTAGDFAPVEVHPQWKVMDGETRLVLNYKANSEGRLGRELLASSSDAILGRKATELTFSATIHGPTVTNVQAKPPGGTWIPERGRMYWRVDDLDFDASAAASAGKIVARWVQEKTGEEVRTENVAVKWRCDGVLTSGLGVVVVDGEDMGFKFEEVKKAVVSNKYLAE